MSTKKKDFTFKSTPEGAINMADDVPQVEHGVRDAADAEKWGDFGPQYHTNAVCCDYRNYAYRGEAKCTDGWRCSYQTCLNCGNELTVWYPPWEGDQHE